MNDPSKVKLRAGVAAVILAVLQLVVWLLAANMEWDDQGSFVFGLLSAQVGLAAVWTGLGPLSWPLRTLGAFMITAFATLVMLLGAGGNLSGIMLLVLASFLLLEFVLALVWTLLIPRWVLGKLLIEESDAPVATRRQFTIRQIMLWTTGVAVVLAAGRLLLSATWQWGQWEGTLAIAYTLIFAINSAIPAPLAAAIFQPRVGPRFVLVVPCVLLLAILTWLEGWVFSTQLGYNVTGDLIVMNSAQFAWISVCCIVALLGGVRFGGAAIRSEEATDAV